MNGSTDRHLTPENAFADLLRRFRTDAAITQEELAERAGLSRNAISALERGARSRPQRATVDLLANALDLTGDDLAAFVDAARVARAARAEPSPVIETPNNLPLSPTSLIGREVELAQASALLTDDEVRLLTLTGTGGVGKTRLALEVAANLRRSFPDGVYLIRLASLSDPDLLADAIAQTLGAKEDGDRSVLDALIAYLRERRILLLLDNFEHLAVGATLLADLLAVCGGLKLFVTSRAPVHIRGEHLLLVSPLALPGQADSLDQLEQVPAVALFIHRARAADPSFQLADGNGPEVAEICRRLDGLPLAIELAAARIPLLPPKALLNRLIEARTLPLLTEGPFDLPERQQTLRRTLEWSHDLLDSGEQLVFRRLAIFAGGATLDAAEAVTRGPEFDGADRSLPVLDLIASLVDKNLLRRDESTTAEPRFGMLETVREFSLDLLETSGEIAEIRQRAVDYFLALAEHAESQMTGPDQRAWLDRLEAEHDNLRASLAWTAEYGEIETHLRLASALSYFWFVRGHAREGKEWLETAVEQARNEPSLAGLRAKTLSGAANLNTYLGDFTAATAFAEEALAIARDLDDKREIARALNRLASIAGQRGDYQRIVVLDEEALLIHQELGNQPAVAGSFADLGQAAFNLGNLDRAEELLSEGIKLLDDLGQQRGVSIALGNLGRVALARGDLAQAASCFQQSISIDRELGYKRGLAIELDRLAHVARRTGELQQARDLQGESFGLWRELGDPVDLILWLEGVAALEAVSGHHEAAARLLGAASAGREEVGYDLAAPPTPGDDLTPTVDASLAALGEAAFAAAVESGRETSIEDALAAAERVVSGADA
jgi:predicted ATPase/DNA-binding XRE family transcriptional regulator